MCDDFIHQGLTHDPAVSRRAFMVSTAATVVLTSAAASAEAKVVEKDVNVPMASGVSDSALFYPEGKGTWPAVLVWPDILGLRPVFREMGRRLAAEGYDFLSDGASAVKDALTTNGTNVNSSLISNGWSKTDLEQVLGSSTSKLPSGRQLQSVRSNSPMLRIESVRHPLPC